MNDPRSCVKPTLDELLEDFERSVREARKVISSQRLPFVHTLIIMLDKPEFDNLHIFSNVANDVDFFQEIIQSMSESEQINSNLN